MDRPHFVNNVANFRFSFDQRQIYARFKMKRNLRLLMIYNEFFECLNCSRLFDVYVYIPCIVIDLTVAEMLCSNDFAYFQRLSYICRNCFNICTKDFVRKSRRKKIRVFVPFNFPFLKHLRWFQCARFLR